MQAQKLGVKKLSIFSLFTLLLANGVVIWQFATNEGSILQVLWIYWLQSVLIGLINIFRILSSPLKIISDENPREMGFQMSNLRLPDILVKYGAATFFTLHYGLFHFVYAIFLVGFGSSDATVVGFNGATSRINLGTVSVGLIFLNGAIFLLHHIFTLLSERAQLKVRPDESPNIRELMARPYKRIIPMHIILIFGPLISVKFNNTALFGIFIALKILVDIGAFYSGSSHPGTLSAANFEQSGNTDRDSLIE